MRWLLDAEDVCGETSDDTKLLGVLIPALVCGLVFVYIFSSRRKIYPRFYMPNGSIQEQEEQNLKTFAKFVWNSDAIVKRTGFDAYIFLEVLKTCYIICLYSLPFACLTLIVYATGGELSTSECGLLPLLSMSNLPTGFEDSWGLWAPFFQMTFIVVLSLYYIKHLYQDLVEADGEEQNHPRTNIAYFSVMYYNISDLKAFKSTMQNTYGESLVDIYAVPDTSIMHENYTTWVKAGEKVKLIEDDGEKAALCGCYGGIGTLQEADLALKDATEIFRAHNPSTLCKCPVAIVTFNKKSRAIHCAEHIVPNDGGLKARLCPKKNDLYYENLNRSEEEKSKGRKRGTIAYIVLIIMFSPLMVLIQGLADLDSLSEDSSLVKDITDLSSPLTAMLQGFLPVIIFAAFFAFLPKLLWMIVDMSFPQSKTDQESRVLPMYTDCLIGMGLLVSVFAAVFSGGFTSVSDITDTAAEEMPSQSVFWMGYILNAAFFGVALELSAIVRIAVASIMGYKQPEIKYYLVYPGILMMFCLTLTYSVIAPITLLWGVIYFGASYWVFKYMLLYVYKPTRSCYTRKFFPGIFSRFHFGIFISQFILFGLFLSYSAVGQAILTFLAMIVTIASARSANRGFDYYFFPDDKSGISEVSSLLME